MHLSALDDILHTAFWENPSSPMLTARFQNFVRARHAQFVSHANGPGVPAIAEPLLRSR